jgi:hypothetical protein
MFRTVTLRVTTADQMMLAECSDCGALVRPEEAVLLMHEATHGKILSEHISVPTV